VAEGQLTLAEQNLRLAEASEGAGSITSLDGDSARLLHLQAEIGVVREQINRDLAAVRLRMAMGDF
jgi:outer membrane protein TolC